MFILGWIFLILISLGIIQGVIYIGATVFGISELLKPFYRWLMLIEEDANPPHLLIPEQDPEL